jgi:hypothetical protein
MASLADDLRKDRLAQFKKKLRAAEDAVLAESRRVRELDSALSSARTVRQATLPRSMQNRGA